jgi:hypothetical protein
VLDPSRLRENLIVLDLMAGNLLPLTVEHHEPRAGRALIHRSDVLTHVLLIRSTAAERENRRRGEGE